jgi:hypothetical protein
MVDTPASPGGIGGGFMDAVTQLANIARQLGLVAAAFKGRFVFGTFTLTAAASTTVLQPAVQANSMIVWTPTNAAAGTLEGSAKKLYYSISPGVSFTVTTASGGAAVGNEGFQYAIFSPS